MKKQFLVLGAFALAGCAGPAQTPEQKALLEELAHRPMTCQAGKDCDDKWNKAIQWVSGHSQRGAKRITKNLIEGYMMYDDPSHPSIRAPEYNIMRYEKGQGVYAIEFRSYCDAGLYCNPSGLKLRASFVTAIMGPPPGVVVNGESATKIIHTQDQ